MTEPTSLTIARGNAALLRVVAGCWLAYVVMALDTELDLGPMFRHPPSGAGVVAALSTHSLAMLGILSLACLAGLMALGRLRGRAGIAPLAAALARARRRALPWRNLPETPLRIVLVRRSEDLRRRGRDLLDQLARALVVAPCAPPRRVASRGEPAARAIELDRSLAEV